MYSEEDMQLLEMIRCLKNTGMPVNEIGAFIALCGQGDGTLDQRRQMLLAHQAHVEDKIDRMCQELEHIQHKLAYYDKVCGQAQQAKPAGDSCGGK